MKITTEEESALHEYLNRADELARFIRLTSGGQLTLTVAENKHVSPGKQQAAGIVGLGMEAHDYAHMLATADVPEHVHPKRCRAT